MRPTDPGALALFFLAAAALSAQPAVFQDNKKAVLYVGSAPVIDGETADWEGLRGSSPEKWTFGDYKASRDPSAVFVLRADSKNLYVLAEVIDSVANENELPAPLAWRNDSLEVYIGVGDSSHTRYAAGDNQIRLVPMSRSEPRKLGVSVNDRVVAESDIEGFVVYTEQGYRIEASLPLRILRIKGFVPGQTIRAEFQINDATTGERENMLHWNSTKDNTYYDASSWGDGVVEALPEGL